ncbi:hypothetical protein Tco_1315298 [Tanacetum coccineum]
MLPSENLPKIDSIQTSYEATGTSTNDFLCQTEQNTNLRVTVQDAAASALVKDPEPPSVLLQRNRLRERVEEQKGSSSGESYSSGSWLSMNKVISPIKRLENLPSSTAELNEVV